MGVSNSLNSDQARCFVGSDLSQNCLQSLSIGRQQQKHEPLPSMKRVKADDHMSQHMRFWYLLLCQVKKA